MENVFEWVKNHKILVAAIIIFIFFFPICAVHLLFKIPNRYEFGVAEWSAGDILSYISGFYVLLGTITFSALALYQNYIINRQNEQYNQKLREMEIQRDLPRFVIENTHSNGNYSNLHVKIKNISDNSAGNVKILNLSIYDANEKSVYQSAAVNTNSDTIAAQSSMDVDLNNPVLSGSNLKVCFCIKYQDKFLNYHQVEVTGLVSDSQKYGKMEFITEDRLINEQ